MTHVNPPEIGPCEIGDAITKATGDVFSTMLGLQTTAGEACDEAESAASPHDGVMALVGIAGSWSGTGLVYCSQKLACHIAGAMLQTQYPAVNEEVLDAVAEVANMIVGNVKTVFEERLGRLALSIPAVVFGRDHYTHNTGARGGTMVPFHCGGEMLEVRFCLVESPQPTVRPRYDSASSPSPG
jgi:chemotaxis protein CheX